MSLAPLRLWLAQQGLLHSQRQQSADHLAGWALQQWLPFVSSKATLASQRGHGVWLCNHLLVHETQVSSRFSKSPPASLCFVTRKWTPTKSMCFRCRPEFLEEFIVAGTIQDYVVSMLCGLDGCVMTPQNAASWGFFNTSSNQWNVDMYAKCRASRFNNTTLQHVRTFNWYVTASVAWKCLIACACLMWPAMTKLFVTYSVRVGMCNLHNKPLCVCMLQSEGCRLPFAPASSVCAVWWLGGTDVFWLAWYPCWYASRGSPGRLPVLCLLLPKCTDGCRWNRKSSHLSDIRVTLDAVGALLSDSPCTLDSCIHYLSDITGRIH